ncbi:ureidoglycolate lyase [Sneathiella marina]|uniref:Ureidoglycolate lyase n=1 Tax=Sneathiella marina TaxID=2950108 RepID=A0ABY4W5G5_9PROT|nr:ureidoglycolate lyase [Sneathiella marina]USG62283.1 ureidoglycolate lyase [Sneathiella marina]
MKLSIEPLTKESFAPYGDVIETSGSDFFPINNGSTQRFHDLAEVQLDAGARTLVNIFRATPLSYPLNIRMVERHPVGSQAFVPLNNRPYLVAVAPRGDVVSVDDLKIFSARGDQGVNYHAGTWHHPVLALEAVSDFLVIDRGGEGPNCDEFFFDEPEIWIDL